VGVARSAFAYKREKNGFVGSTGPVFFFFSIVEQHVVESTYKQCRRACRMHACVQVLTAHDCVHVHAPVRVRASE
jgi:hypothetical protein